MDTFLRNGRDAKNNTDTRDIPMPLSARLFVDLRNRKTEFWKYFNDVEML